MSRRFLYLTHTQIVRDPEVPIPRWRLSDFGRERLEAIDWAALLPDLRIIYSSGQTRALETASVIADALHIPMEVRDEMREADRGAMGYVADGSFASIMDRFFAEADESVMGWESARDAQGRIVSAVDKALEAYSDGEVLFVGHGTVGALLYCRWAGHSISGEYRQSEEGGNLFAFDTASGGEIFTWTSLEALANDAGERESV